MLSQEELDKLLEEEGNAEGEGAGQDADGGAEAAAEDAGPVSQDELDKLLEGGADEAGGDAGSDDIDWGDAFKEAAEGGDPAAAKALNEGSVEEELSSQQAAAQQSAPAADFSEFKNGKAAEGTSPDLDFLLEIPLEVSVELGRSSMRIKDLLKLGQGSVVELNKMAGEPAEIYVNKKLLAKGEVVVINEKFGVKLTEIISPADRVKTLG
jgi:flagellar motor switch protein FliN/FliY